jgi:undecaprenyl-diphosphatase
MTGSARRQLTAFAVLLAAFVALLVLVVTTWDPLQRLDLRVAGNLHDVALAHPGQVTFWKWVSLVLHPEVERVAAAIIAVVLWLKQRRGPAIFIAVVMVGEAVLETIVKVSVGRHRPEFEHPVADAAGNSFPSGHALGAVVTFGLLVIVVSQRYRIAAAAAGLVAALLVSYARLALGVHYLSDVLGAWLLGLAWLVLAYWLLADRLLTPGHGRGWPVSRQ